VRRKFFEARTSAPVLAHTALARIRQLYAVEGAAEGLSAEGRRALRQRDSVPLLTAFEEWLTEQGRHVLPKSPIGQAIAYTQSNWAALCRYPEHGELSIDNNPPRGCSVPRRSDAATGHSSAATVVVGRQPFCTP
jgi:transposase